MPVKSSAKRPRSDRMRAAQATSARKRRERSDAAIREAVAKADHPLTYPELAERAGMSIGNARTAAKRLHLATRTEGRKVLILPTGPDRAVEQLPADAPRHGQAVGLALGALRATPYRIDGAFVLIDEGGHLYAARPLVEDRA